MFNPLSPKLNIEIPSKNLYTNPFQKDLPKLNIEVPNQHLKFLPKPAQTQPCHAFRDPKRPTSDKFRGSQTPSRLGGFYNQGKSLSCNLSGHVGAETEKKIKHDQVLKTGEFQNKLQIQ